MEWNGDALFSAYFAAGSESARKSGLIWSEMAEGRRCGSGVQGVEAERSGKITFFFFSRTHGITDGFLTDYACSGTILDI
ncbi:hypothetical protein GM415_06465 [Pseudodesulfovibrio cashew]|uniref:Uncharacterized protein n=2 Tax=Pseudodesulfovibrio cashew TaxID=2678688 RepID=A0A6I6JFJ0_9BACT|nr:hypothetical protein GM415_06465 [Pseudodesulfovibrio cashew]